MSRTARPRIRTIKPEHWQDERLAETSRDARLFYLGLMTRADDEGRQSAHPALLRAHCCPFDLDAEPAIPGWLDELVDAGVILRYEVDGRQYIAITSWLDDQRIANPAKFSSNPPPPDAGGGEQSRASSGFLAIPPEESRGCSPSRAPAGPGPGPGPDQDPDQERDPDAPTGAGARDQDIQNVFDAWVTATERDQSRTKLDPARRRLIDKRLRSHGINDCLAAVRNIGASNGANSARDGYGRGQRFDDIKHALGTSEQVERWREDQTPKQAGVASSRDLAYLDDGVLSADYDDEQAAIDRRAA